MDGLVLEFQALRIRVCATKEQRKSFYFMIKVNEDWDYDYCMVAVFRRMQNVNPSQYSDEFSG